MMAYESNLVVILTIIYNALSKNKNYNLQRQPWSLEFMAAQQEVYIIDSVKASRTRQARVLRFHVIAFSIWNICNFFFGSLWTR